VLLHGHAWTRSAQRPLTSIFRGQAANLSQKLPQQREHLTTENEILQPCGSAHSPPKRALYGIHSRQSAESASYFKWFLCPSFFERQVSFN
jgi:hypothetical protein